MPEDEWEFVPHKILADLRDEVQGLKDKLTQPATNKELFDSMGDLKNSIKQLHDLFGTALSQMRTEEEEMNVGKTLQRLTDKLEILEKQNEQIAKAMVAIADMVKEIEKRHEAPSMSQRVPFPPRPAQPAAAPYRPMLRPAPSRPGAPPMPAPMQLPEEPMMPEPEFAPPPMMPGPGMPPLPPPPLSMPPTPEKKGILGKLFRK